MGVTRRLLAVGALALGTAACTTVVDQDSFAPRPRAAPAGELVVPSGYSASSAMIPLPGLGEVHAVRLVHPAAEATILVSGGNGHFVNTSGKRIGALASATGANLIVYDYPGRGGTTIPNTIEASVEAGPKFVAALRERGWIDAATPVFAYGFSFGGSQAAGHARAGGFAGLIIEGSAADTAAVARNFVPAIARPFVRLEIDPALAAFDYFGYAVAARAPILLLAARDDETVTTQNIEDFARQLREAGATVTVALAPGPHGAALASAEGTAAVGDFVRAQTAGAVAPP